VEVMGLMYNPCLVVVFKAVPDAFKTIEFAA
jgi:hypothetical protein